MQHPFALRVDVTPGAATFPIEVQLVFRHFLARCHGCASLNAKVTLVHVGHHDRVAEEVLRIQRLHVSAEALV